MSHAHCDHKRLTVVSDKVWHQDGLHDYMIGTARCDDCPLTNLRVIKYKLLIDWRSWRIVDQKTCDHSVYSIMKTEKRKKPSANIPRFCELFVDRDYLYRHVKCSKCEHQFGMVARYKTVWKDQQEVAEPISDWERVVANEEIK